MVLFFAMRTQSGIVPCRLSIPGQSLIRYAPRSLETRGFASTLPSNAALSSLSVMTEALEGYRPVSSYSYSREYRALEGGRTRMAIWRRTLSVGTS